MPHFLEFGARSSTLARVVFQGDRRAALAQLRRSCRDIAERAASWSGAAVEEASTGRAAEERLLQRLRDIVPVEQGEGWRIYQHDGPVLMVVAARVCSVGAERGEPPATRLDSVLSWGVGLLQYDAASPGAPSPGAASPARWTLLTYSAAARVTGGDASLAWLVPPGGRRTMSMQVEQGGTLVGLVGEGSPRAWVGFFDDAFAQRGWVRQAGWDCPGQVWHARYGRAELETCDVQLAGEEDGVISGILTITRVAGGDEERPGQAGDGSATGTDEGGAKPRAER
ncbi:MAG: hypothetical protein FJ276_13220 [Planctomycetes bacterium]|nr:hypothetical protein [Planctomycetota bacterium]